MAQASRADREIAAKVNAKQLPNSSVTSQSASRTWPTVRNTPLTTPLASLLAPTKRVPANNWKA